MAVNNVNYNDTLRDGTDKINQSIDQSNQAIDKANSADTKADSAISTANQANTKSDDTQQQLNNIVINNGESDAEVLQARGSYSVLNERLQAADAQLADTESLVKTVPKTINQGLATNALSRGAGFTREPMVAVTFDDGYMNDFTQAKPLMDSFGFKGTIYLNTSPDLSTPRLTDTEVIQLHNEGWEFGSHTDTHTALSAITLNKAIVSGDTTIELINSAGTPLIKTNANGVILRVNTSDDITFNVINHSLSGGILTLTLDKPSQYDIAKSALIFLHEESVVKEITPPKEYLNNLGIPCVGIAYPYGSATSYAKKAVQSHFNYARWATSFVGNTNGGILDGDEIPFKQFTLDCTEVLAFSETDVDNLLNKIVEEKSLLIVLGHTNGWATLEPKLRMFLEKVAAKGVAVKPLKDALLHHGNTTDLSDLSISKDGKMTSGGMNIISGSGITAQTGIKDFPMGVTFTRVSDSSAGFPSNVGMLQTVKTKETGLSWWAYQMWHEFDGVTKVNQIYYRVASGSYTWSAWKRLTPSSVSSVSRNGLNYHRAIGESVFDTTLGKPLWVKQPGAREVDTLTINSGASASGNVSVKLNTTTYNIAVAAGQTAEQVASAIRSNSFTGWTVSGTGNQVVFTKQSMAANQTPTFTDVGGTGVTGNMVVTVLGESLVWVDSTGTTV
jgi:Polysaccharide deacetylase